MNLFNLRRHSPSLEEMAAHSAPSKAGNPPSRDCLMPCVERESQVFVRGQGSWMWDSDSRAYLDFTQGSAANSLGHSPAVLVKAMTEQAQSLLNPGAGFLNRGN